jgi:chemotaxis signal transduction protein
VGDRRVALAVDAVLGIHTVSAKALAQLPGLIGAVAAGFVESLGLLDTELFMLLRTGHLIPESAWSALGLEA